VPLLPSNIVVLSFGSFFNEPVSSFHSNLLHITFGDAFNQEITDVLWPVTLIALKFGEAFNKNINGITWPKSMNTLTLGDTFNQYIDNIDISYIIFGAHFNQDISHLSNSNFINLMFGHYFNNALPHELPQLILLALDNQFNRADINDILLPKLCILILSYAFNQILTTNFLRYNNSLTDMIFGTQYNQDISPVKWPESLLHISFGATFNPINIINAQFKYLSTVEDYACSITIDSCKFPPSLSKITHINSKIEEIIIYERKIGKYTKRAVMT
jgi:hypothetical protein